MPALRRILLWSEAYLPATGGVEVLLNNLAAALVARGHAVSVVTLGDGPEHEVIDGVDVYRLPMRAALEGGSPLAAIEMIRRVAALKRRIQPDVVHLHFLGPTGFFHLKTLASHPAATVVTIHGELHDSIAAPGTIFGQLLDLADRVTAVSESMREDVVRRAPHAEQKTVVIHNSRELPPPSQVDCGTGPYCYCVGRLHREKGFDLAIDAVARLRAERPDLRLVIAGVGGERENLERQAHDLGLGEAVSFVGYVDAAAQAGWMSNALAVLTPSRCREGFGLAALEAALLGRPVVAARVGGLPEVVLDGRTGLLVEPESAEALADAVRSLLADPERAAAMGAAAAQSARERFAFADHVAAHEQLYRDLEPAARSEPADL